MKSIENDVKRAETKLLQGSTKNLIHNLNNYFKSEKVENVTLKEKNRHTI